MQRRGSFGYAQNLAHALAGAALHEFQGAFASAVDGRDKRFIEALPYWVLERA
jgi:geranylgeranyl diphosphate synthase type II